MIANLEKVIVEAPDFKPFWDTAFEAWKDYIISKEETKGKMATYESKKGKQNKPTE